MIRITVGYPEREDEIRILSGEKKNPAEGLSSVITPEGLLALRQEVSRIHVEESLYGYMVDIARATRNHPDIRLGVSPRGTMALAAMTRAHALMEGRSYATPDDVAAVAPYTLGHRISLSGDARYAGKTAESVLSSLLSALPLPSLKEE